MTRLSFDYHMALHLSEEVSRHTFLLRFFPQTDGRQHILHREIVLTPDVALPLQTDAFGNLNGCGHIEGAHRDLELRVTGRAEIGEGGCPGSCGAIWTMPTQLTRAEGELLTLGSDITESDPLRSAEALSVRLRERVEYRSGITGDRTTAAEAWRLGGGVCQDMAHLLIAVLRARAVPARYVAGLIPGEGETHAWVEVWRDGAWYGYDPTHLRPTDGTYLVANRGRDSRDCSIDRGVFTGTALQTLRVSAIMDIEHTGSA